MRQKSFLLELQTCHMYNSNYYTKSEHCTRCWLVVVSGYTSQCLYMSVQEQRKDIQTGIIWIRQHYVKDQ